MAFRDPKLKKLASHAVSGETPRETFFIALLISLILEFFSKCATERTNERLWFS
jgi:hypothetical protein